MEKFDNTKNEQIIFNGVNSIEFEVSFEGNGIVNGESNDQIIFLTNGGIIEKNDSSFYYKGKCSENMLLAKKNFQINEDEPTKNEFHYKISSQCLRKQLFDSTIPVDLANINHIPNVFYSAIAHPDLILRGYLYPDTKETVKKKSGLSLPDAEEIGPWRQFIALDTHTRSGEKISKEDRGVNDKTSDTTFYKVENVGKVTYQTRGGFDIEELSFISADKIFDRLAVNVDGGFNEKLYISNLQKHFNKDYDFKYYYKSNSYLSDEFGERGILFDNEDLNKFMQRILKYFIEFKILRSNAFLKISKFTLFIYTDNGVKEIDVTYDNVNKLYFNFNIKYCLADEYKIIRNRVMYELNKKYKIDESIIIELINETIKIDEEILENIRQTGKIDKQTLDNIMEYILAEVKKQ